MERNHTQRDEKDGTGDGNDGFRGPAGSQDGEREAQYENGEGESLRQTVTHLRNLPTGAT